MANARFLQVKKATQHSHQLTPKYKKIILDTNQRKGYNYT